MQDISYKTLSQYLQNCYIETPNRPMGSSEPLNVSLSMSVAVTDIKDNVYKVLLTIGYNCSSSPKQLEEDKISIQSGNEVIYFVGKTSYAFIVSINQEKDLENKLEDVYYCLNVDIPNLIFPFVYNIIYMMTSSCGFTPLMLGHIDFKQVYLSKLASQANSDMEDEYN